MPKKPPRLNQTVRERRTVQGAAAVLQRINQRLGSAQGISQAPGLLQRLRSDLPEDLRAHLVDAIEKPDELVCFVDSAVWAGRLRLAAAERQSLTGSRRLVVRIRPGNHLT